MLAFASASTRVTEEQSVLQAVKDQPWTGDDGATLLKSAKVTLAPAPAGRADDGATLLKSKRVTLAAVSGADSGTSPSDGASLGASTAPGAGGSEAAATSRGATLGLVSSSSEAAARDLSRQGAAAAANELSSDDAPMALGQSSNASGAPTAGGLDSLARPAAHAPSEPSSLERAPLIETATAERSEDPPSLERASLIETAALDMERSEDPPSLEQASLIETAALDLERSKDPPSAAPVLPPVRDVNGSRFSLLAAAVRLGAAFGSRSSLSSLAAQAQLASGSELIFAVVFIVACCLMALVVMCSLEASPDKVASGYQRRPRPSHVDIPRENSSLHTPSTPVQASRTRDDGFMQAVVHRLSDPAVLGKKHLGHRRSSGTSAGLASSMDLPARASQARRSLADEKYVVPSANECHIALPSLLNRPSSEGQQSVTDPNGGVLFYVGFVRGEDGGERLVLQDAERAQLGSCALAAKGQIGGPVVSDARGQRYAVIEADAAKRYTLKRLAHGGSWHLLTGEEGRPARVQEEGRPVAHVAFEGGGPYQVYISPHTDVCILILFILCCERLGAAEAPPSRASRARVSTPKAGR